MSTNNDPVSGYKGPLQPWIEFSTISESGCVVVSCPDWSGTFVGLDSEGVECSFGVAAMADNNLSSNKVQDMDLSSNTRGQDHGQGADRLATLRPACDDCGGYLLPCTASATGIHRSINGRSYGCDALAGSRILRERFGYGA